MQRKLPTTVVSRPMSHRTTEMPMPPKNRANWHPRASFIFRSRSFANLALSLGLLGPLRPRLPRLRCHRVTPLAAKANRIAERARGRGTGMPSKQGSQPP
jgi:hypothetical protein